MKINLSEAEQETPATIITPGDYQVIVTDAEEGESSKGTPCITVTLELLDGGEFKGRTLRDWLYTTPKAIWRVGELMHALGLEVPQGDFDLNPAQLIGRQAKATVSHEVWEGKVKTRLGDYRRVEEEIAPPASDGVPF